MNLTFSLPVLLPFRLDLTVWALRRRMKNIIDQWDGVQYTRVIILDHVPVKIKVFQKEGSSEIIVTTITQGVIPQIQERVSKILERMLGLTVNLEGFYKIAKEDDRIRPVVDRFMGLKPPRFYNAFEAFANAIACQQVSLEAGLSVLNKLVIKLGISYSENNQIQYAFPEAKRIMGCKIEELKECGLSTRKSETLIRLATYIAKYESEISELDLEEDHIQQFLKEIKGIGRWSLEYTLLRGVGKINILPGDDVGFQKNLQKTLRQDQNFKYESVKAIEKLWYPYGGMLYFHLLLQSLHEKEVIV